MLLFEVFDELEVMKSVNIINKCIIDGLLTLLPSHEAIQCVIALVSCCMRDVARCCAAGSIKNIRCVMPIGLNNGYIFGFETDFYTQVHVIGYN